MMGKVYLVGAGPGAVDLLTLRGARILAEAEIVFFDALVSKEILALAAQAIQVPVGKRSGIASTDQRIINRCLVTAAQHYQCVVRLKGGDPMVFGRAQEELDALDMAGVETEVVPGITAVLAASAQVKIALTRRGSCRSIILATPAIGEGEADSDWAAAIKSQSTVALYMGLNQSERMMHSLMSQGVPGNMPVLVLENVSTGQARQLATTLSELPSAQQWRESGPVLVLIGRVFDRLVRAEAKELLKALS
ncbi:MAG: uroporphyrinogen-III C-methyltransferase [Proteobacteria bacterium]|nr:uroporphyrinogen-III C-methyltransferase [Pseudomonadota bacterium]MDE3208390.1 uroporphyrinogen-III C-methyltransferase [Pseudomonadota bacterium]